MSKIKRGNAPPPKGRKINLRYCIRCLDKEAVVITYSKIFIKHEVCPKCKNITPHQIHSKKLMKRIKAKLSMRPFSEEEFRRKKDELLIRDLLKMLEVF